MIKLQFKLPQTLISRGFTRRTVLHAPAFQQKGINRLMDIYQIWKPKLGYFRQIYNDYDSIFNKETEERSPIWDSQFTPTPLSPTELTVPLTNSSTNSNVTTPIPTSPTNGIILPQSDHHHSQQQFNCPVPELIHSSVHVAGSSNLQHRYIPMSLSPDELHLPSNVTTPITTSPGNGITLLQTTIYPEHHSLQRSNHHVPEVHVPHGSNIQTHYFPTTYHLSTTRHLPRYTYNSPTNERVVHYAVRSKSNGFRSFVGELMDHYYTREEQIYGKVNMSARKYNGTTVR